ncbi:MAG TPA: hypothetical protein VM120_07640 [Bryobacteraceae bacterium]|nr:hypothetical protein [Bryobacteraceae bacterium]
MPIRLSKIDDLTRPDHFFIEAADECLYLGEYTARKGYQFSDTNNLIFNLKKPMERRDQPGWNYKRRAVEKAGRQLREALDALNPKWLSMATLVPMPPSKVKSDPMYDDRLIQMLRVLGTGIQLDIREMIAQRESTEAAHSTEARPRVDELCDNYSIEESLVDPPPRVIGVIDDVLTTGSHFKAAQRLLRSRFPAVKIYGIFVARRVPDSGDITGF